MNSDSSLLSDDEDLPPQRRRRIRFIRNRADPFEMLNERDFKLRFRLSKQTVRILLVELGPGLEPLTRRNKAISPEIQILICLRFYATGAFQQLIGDYIHIDKSSVSRIVCRVTKKIAALSVRYIKMPTNADEQLRVKSEFFNVCGFPRVVGALDCTHVRIESPGGINAELFRNRKGYFSINVQAICDADLKIMHVIARWPGSVHDSTIFNNSPLPVEFRRGLYGNGVLLGDSGYPCKSYLLTPLLNPNNPSEEEYNRCHIRTRNTIERMFGVLKRRFPCLGQCLRLKLNTSLMVIVACSVVHNVCKDQNDIFDENDFEQEENYDNWENENIPYNNGNENYAVRNAFITSVFRQ